MMVKTVGARHVLTGRDLPRSDDLLSPCVVVEGSCEASFTLTERPRVKIDVYLPPPPPSIRN